MAIRYAVANGNWSSASTWDGTTTIPADGDTVYPNNFTVTIDQNINPGVLTNATLASPAITAGGTFNMTGNYTINCSGNFIQAGGTTVLLTCSGSGTSNISFVSIPAPTAGTNTLTISGTGTFNLTFSGSITGGSSSRDGVRVTSNSGTINISGGSVIGGSSGAGISVTGTAPTITVSSGTFTTGTIAGISLGASTGGTFTLNGGTLGGGAGTSSGILVSGSTAVNVSASIQTSVSTGITLAGTSNSSAIFSGNVIGSSSGAVSTLIITGIYNSTIENIYSSTVATAAVRFSSTAGGTSTIGNIYCPGIGGGILADGSVAINVNGVVSPPTSATPTISFSSGASGSLATIGNVTGSSSGTVAAINFVAGSTTPHTHTGNLIAGAATPALINPSLSSLVQVTGSIFNNGTVAGMTAAKFRFGSGDFQWITQQRVGITDSAYPLYSTGVLAAGMPAETDVRVATVYGPSNEFTGLLSTSGNEYTLTQIADAVWGYPTTSANVSGSLGERMANVATVATTGAQIAGYSV